MARVGWLGWRRVARVCRAYPRRVHSHARACAQAKAEAAQLTEEGARQAAALCAAEAHAAKLQVAFGPLHLLHLCTLRTLSAPPPHRLRTPPHPAVPHAGGTGRRDAA